MEINDDAMQYLNSLEKEKKQIKIKSVSEANKLDLHAFCKSFISKSESWRKNSYEDNWQKWQRNADSTFDPSVAAKKKSWQSKVVVPMTASHRENVKAHLFRTLFGIRPPLEMKSRNVQIDDQSENIKDIILREMEKTRFETTGDKILDDATIYGSGFCRIRWEEKYEDREIRELQEDNVNVFDLKALFKRFTGKGGKHYDSHIENICSYKGLRFEWVNIWDVFPDPKALVIPGSPIAYRFRLTYDDIVQGVAKGYYLPESKIALQDIESDDTYSDGEDIVQSERGIDDQSSEKTKFSKGFKCYEFFAMLPEKWVIGGDKEKLIVARILFNKYTLIAIEPSDAYDNEPPIFKLDYMPVASRFYGIGIPEMLEHPQLVVNEVVNQRLDNGALILNKGLGIIQKALVNPKEDLESKPGMMVRLNDKVVQQFGGIDRVMKELRYSDTPVRAGFAEVNDAERWAQERTSANRVTLGTAGQVQDSNQTLGGQKMLRESAGIKFAYIGLLMEFSFMSEIFRAFWKIIYKNIDFEEIKKALGPDRVQTFKLLTPEEVDRDYVYRPRGVFTMENKFMNQQMYQNLFMLFGQQPWFDPEATFDKIVQLTDDDPEQFKKKVPPTTGMPGMEGQMPMEGEGGAMPPQQQQDETMPPTPPPIG